MKIEAENLAVNDRQTFIVFIKSLAEDYRSGGHDWENNNLADFLEALSRYAEDIQGYYDNTAQSIDADKPSWKVFADLIKGATIYE